MTDTQWKQWLMRHDRGIQALALHPERKLAVIANVYSIPAAELQAFLDRFNDGARDLSPTKLYGLKQELGIVGETSTAPRRDDAGDTENETEEQPETPPARKPRAKAAAADSSESPWLKRGGRPRSNGLATHRERLERIAANGDAGKIDGAWTQFASKWFGTVRPTAEQVCDFLAWVSEVPAGRSSLPAPAKSTRTPPKPARKPRKVTRRTKVAPRAAASAPAHGPVSGRLISILDELTRLAKEADARIAEQTRLRDGAARLLPQVEKLLAAGGES